MDSSVLGCKAVSGQLSVRVQGGLWTAESYGARPSVDSSVLRCKAVSGQLSGPPGGAMQKSGAVKVRHTICFLYGINIDRRIYLKCSNSP